MNQYETVFILTPVLSDDQMKETVAKFKKILTDNGAEILNEEAWGLKKMAYAIQKKSTGFYCLVEFKAEPSVIKTLETAFRRDEKVLRFQTVKLDKYAVEYAEKRRAKLGKKEECLQELKAVASLAKYLNPNAKAENYQIGLRNPLYFSTIDDLGTQEEFMTTIYFDKLLPRYDGFFDNDEEYLNFKNSLIK